VVVRQAVEAGACDDAVALGAGVCLGTANVAPPADASCDGDRTAPRAVYPMTSVHEATPPPTRTREVILVAEDDPDGAAIIQIWLEHAGYEVVVVEDGASAVAAARRMSPDLVLMDLALPGMDGFAAAAALRACDTTCAIPIVVLTALALADGHARAIAIGVNGYLCKPAPLVDILETVACVMRSSRVARATRGH
jgi:CheY-like chemotaxis protein